jgi:cytosine permease
MGLIDRINRVTQDYSHEPVPDDKTRHGWRIFGVWVAGQIALPIFMLGITLGNSMNVRDALIALIAGQFIVTVMFCLTAYGGSVTRLPVAILLRQTLGKYGASIVSVLLAFSLIGWFGFQTEIFGQSLQTLINSKTGIMLPLPLLIVGGGVIMSTTAIIGFKALDILSQIAIPLLVVLLAVPLWQLWDPQALISLMNKPRENAMPLGAAISIVAGSVSVGMLITPDIVRYAHNPRHALAGTGAAQLLAVPVILIFAMALSLLAGEKDFVALIEKLGLGGIGLVTVMLATWTTNDTNIYLSSLALTSIFTSVRKWMLAAICGALGTIVGLVGIVEHFVPWLSLLGIVFAPAAGVFAIDYFLRPVIYKSAHETLPPAYRLRPLIAWGIGTLTGWLTSPEQALGAEMFTLTTIPAIDAILVAGVLHYCMSKINISQKP